ncbi:DUF4189 domain-containing protein [Rhodanobacter sp. BL-MT-08]
MKFLSTLAMMGCLYVPLAWSQCSGVNGGGGCVPPPCTPGSPLPCNQAQPQEQQMAPQPQAVWADRWGAIVIDSQTGRGKGTVTGYASKDAAINAAMSECVSQGAPACKLVLSYYNQCAAVAWGSTHHFTAGDANQSEAESDALQHCNEKTTNCKIVYSACSMAQRIR